MEHMSTEGAARQRDMQDMIEQLRLRGMRTERLIQETACELYKAHGAVDLDTLPLGTIRAARDLAAKALGL